MLKNIILACTLLMLLCSVAAADEFTGTYTKTSNLTYNINNTQLTGIGFNAANITEISATVTPLHTEISPYNISLNGLTAWWRFDEESGTLVQDYSGNGNNGTAVNDMGRTDGKYNTAGSFDGVNDYVTVPYNPLLNNSRTVVMFVNGTYNPTVFTMLYKAYDASAHTGLGLYTYQGKPEFRVGTGTASITCQSGTKLQNNTMYMLSGVCNDTALTLYVDDVAVKNVPFTGQTANYTAIAYIGSFSTSQYFFNGMIDNIMVYNRSLTENEIKSIYYDKIENLQVKTNSNNVYSDEIDNTGTVDVPYNSNDATITSLISYVPETILLSDVTIRNYAKTVSPFELSTAYSYAENVTLVTEDADTGIYDLDILFTPSSSYPTGQITHTTDKLNVDWYDNLNLVSTDLNSNVTYNSTTKQFTVNAGTLTALETYNYNITLDWANVPLADFEADTVTGYAPYKIIFTDTSLNTATPTSYLWNFGDGQTSTAKNPEHTYSEHGIYTVTLTVSNAAGEDVETKTDLITVESFKNNIERDSVSPIWAVAIGMISACVIITLASLMSGTMKGKVTPEIVLGAASGLVVILVVVLVGAVILSAF